MSSSRQSQIARPNGDIDMPNRQKEWRVPSQIARRNGKSPFTCISPFMLAICMHGGIFHVQNSPPLENLYKQPHSDNVSCIPQTIFLIPRLIIKPTVGGNNYWSNTAGWDQHASCPCSLANVVAFYVIVIFNSILHV